MGKRPSASRARVCRRCEFAGEDRLLPAHRPSPSQKGSLQAMGVRRGRPFITSGSAFSLPSKSLQERGVCSRWEFAGEEPLLQADRPSASLKGSLQGMGVCWRREFSGDGSLQGKASELNHPPKKRGKRVWEFAGGVSKQATAACKRREFRLFVGSMQNVVKSKVKGHRGYARSYRRGRLAF